MGQKVNPIGFRLGVNKSWDSTWYQKPSKYTDTLIEDFEIRRVAKGMSEVKDGEVSKIEIARNPQRIIVTFHTSRPGMLVGKGGVNIDKLTKKLTSLTGKKVVVKVVEIQKPLADAQHIADVIARSLVARGSYKRALKKAVQDARKEGVQGIKIRVSGRLNGAEIARSDSIKDGRVPLHTLRSNIDYGFTPAVTSYGVIGVKVWVYNGEILGAKAESAKDDAGSVVRKRSNSQRETKSADKASKGKEGESTNARSTEKKDAE